MFEATGSLGSAGAGGAGAGSDGSAAPTHSVRSGIRAELEAELPALPQTTVDKLTMHLAPHVAGMADDIAAALAEAIVDPDALDDMFGAGDGSGSMFSGFS